MRLEKMQFAGAIKKVASLNLWRQNVMWRKLPTDSIIIEPKCVRIPIFLHISTAHEQGQICAYGFMGEVFLGKKFLRF